MSADASAGSTSTANRTCIYGDSASNYANPHFKHSGTGNFLFVAGHVTTFKPAEIIRPVASSTAAEYAVYTAGPSPMGYYYLGESDVQHSAADL